MSELEPPRLLDTGSAALKAVLEDARDEAPSPAQLDTLTQRLSVLLGPGALAFGGTGGAAPAVPGAPAAPAVPTAPVVPGAGAASVGSVQTASTVAKVAVGGLTKKLLIAGGAVAVGSGGALVARQVVDPPAQVRSAPSVVPVVDLPMQVAGPDNEEVAPAPPEPPVPSPAPAPRPERPLRQLVEQKKARSAVSEDEVALLERAYAQLQGGLWAQALQTADAHQARFAQGTFLQEREVIGVEALVRLGRLDEARVRAERFEERFPTSSHLPRLRRLLGR